MSGTLGLELLILVILIAANGIFAMAEMAIVSARKSRLRQWARQGDRGARIALDLAASPNRFLSTIQFGITLIGILAGAFGGATLARNLSEVFRRLPGLVDHADRLGFGLVVVFITLASLVFGELVPKRLALTHGERLASWLAPAMHLLSRWASPFVYVVGWMTEQMLRVLGVKRQSEAQVSEDDIRLMVEQGSHAGVFHHAEIELVSRVMRLDATRVRDIMSPVMAVPNLMSDDSPEVVASKIQGSHRMFFPLRDEATEKVLGLVSLRDLWERSHCVEPPSLLTLARSTLVVPEHSHAVKLLEALKKSQWHAALVVDEYGETTGVVSMMDLMECIAGRFLSKSPVDASPQTYQDSNGDWVMDGMLTIEETLEALSPASVPAPPPGRYHTLGGLVAVLLGRLPKEGDWVPWGGLRMEVLQMEQYRVSQVRITEAPQKEEASGS